MLGASFPNGTNLFLAKFATPITESVYPAPNAAALSAGLNLLPCKVASCPNVRLNALT